MTNKRWIYVLFSDSLGFVKLEDDPLGWNEQKVSISRNIKYLGLFRSYSTSLRFTGDGLEYLQTVYERNGTEHEINIGIYEYQEKPEDRYTLFFPGVIDLSTYINDQNKYVEVDINESSFARKIISRDDIRVKLNSDKSIDDEDIEQTSPITVNLHQREILSTGTYQLNESSTSIESSNEIIDSQGYDGLALPIFLFSNDDDVENLSTQENSILGAQDSVFFNPLGASAGNISLTGSIATTLSNIFVNTSTISVSFKFWIYEDDTLSVIFEELDIPDATFTVPTGSNTIDVDFDFDVDIGLFGDNKVISLVLVSNESVYRGFQADFTKTDFSVAYNLLWKDNSLADGYLMHEVGQQLTKVITGQDRFVSNFFGRKDIGYEEDGKGSLISLHSAQQIRKLPDAKLSINLTEWYKSDSAMFNLGLGIEYDDVGKPYIRVEEIDHFFNGNVIAELHQVSKLTKSCAREWIYSELNVGYDKSDTEITNGREEYNNKFKWSNFIKTIKNVGDFISKIRTDGYGIEKLRRLSFETNPSDDTREDNDNFAVVVLPDGDDSDGNQRYRSAKDEAYDIVENIFSPESAYNLDLSPGRNLRRNGNKIRAGLEKYLDTNIKFQHADQKANLNSKRTDEDSAISENADILTSDLNDSLWLADIYSCEFVLTGDVYKAILKNPGGPMKLSSGTQEDTESYNYGWILDISYNPNTEKSVGEFLRVNLNNPNLVLVDPIGDSPIVIPPEQPESGEDYGFDGGFPFVFVGPDEVSVSNSYNFTGVEKITIPGIPDFERTSTCYYKCVMKNGAEDNIAYLFNNSGGATQYSGFWVLVYNTGGTNANKILVSLTSDISSNNQINVISTNAVLSDSEYKTMEIWYDGSSDASGVSMSIDSIPIDTTNQIDNLSASILSGQNGFVVGRRKDEATSNDGAFILQSMEFTIDGTKQFETECANNDPDCLDLSAQGNDGSVNRSTSTVEEFYIEI